MDVATGRVVVSIEPSFFRLAEGYLMLGDASRVGAVPGWEVHSTVEHICLRRGVSRVRWPDEGCLWR